MLWHSTSFGTLETSGHLSPSSACIACKQTKDRISPDDDKMQRICLIRLCQSLFVEGRKHMVYFPGQAVLSRNTVELGPP